MAAGVRPTSLGPATSVSPQGPPLLGLAGDYEYEKWGLREQQQPCLLGAVCKYRRSLEKI